MINNDYYRFGARASAIRTLFMHGLKRKAEIGEDKVYDFSLGNPATPTPVEVIDSLKKYSESSHAYSEAAGLMDVREKVANYISHGATAKNVFISQGAAAGLSATICAVTNPGDDVIVIAPHFPEYSVWIKNALCNVVEVKANQDTFEIDVEAVKSSITDKTSAIIINSPCNPSGAVFSEQNIKDLCEVLREHHIYIISDEPYRKITYGVEVPWIPDFYDNTIICDSASKSLSIPGDRIGHIYVNEKCDDGVFEAISGASRALGHVCASVLMQRMYGDCIQLNPDVDAYDRKRKLLCDIMDEVDIKYIKPQGAFYLWIKSPIEDAQEFSDIAKKYDLLIVPSDSFGVKGWLRIGYCVADDTIKNSREAWIKCMS